MTLGIWQIVIIIILALVLFGGAGRIPRIMGDLAKGIKSFKHGLNDDSDESADIDAPKKIKSETKDSTKG